MKCIRGNVGVLCVLVMAVTLVACGGGSGDSEAGEEGNAAGGSGAQSMDGVSVIAKGGIEGLGVGPDSWGFGVMVDNTNGEAKNVKLRVLAYDAGGTLIDTSKVVLLPVQGQSRGAAVGQLIGVLPDQEVASVEVALESVEASWFGTSTITVADVSQDGNVVTGVVSTDAGKDLDNASVEAIIVDSSGVIIGAGVDVAVIASSGTTPFEVFLSGALSGGDLIVLAAPSGVDL